MESQTTQRRRVNQKGKPTIKRLLANKCERERVRKINEAFEILKTHIPYCDSGRIRTKLDVLKFAIDYIQILTKMVSQNEAAMLLRASQMAEKSPGFMLSTGTSETDSPSAASSELFQAGMEAASHFTFDDQQTQLGLSSPTLSDDEVFFGMHLNNDENVPGHYDAWSNHQAGFHQPPTHLHSDQTAPALNTLAQAQTTFEDQQDLMCFWPYQGSDIPKSVMPLEEPTTPPSDNNTSELTAWLNL